MTFSDIMIIYLAIGSPLAVYYLFRSGQEYSIRNFSLSFLVLLSWPINAIWQIRKSVRPGGIKRQYSPDYVNLDARFEQRVDEIRFGMEEIVRARTPERSVFDFREVFERYVGLTTAIALAGADDPSPLASSVLNSEQNAKLNGICLNRRNRRLLEFHHIRARNDFLTLVSDVSEGRAPDLVFGRLALELSALVLDSEAVETLKAGQEMSEQTGTELSVTNLENEVWPSKTPRQSAVSRA